MRERLQRDASTARLKNDATLASVVAIGAILTLIGVYAPQPLMVWIFKPLTTAVIALAAWRRGQVAGDGDRYTRLVVGALLLSLLGDVLLIPQGYFIGGLIAFLVAHLLYIGAFSTESALFAHKQSFAATAIIAVAGLSALWSQLASELRLPVLAYVAALAIMAAQAHSRARLAPSVFTIRAARGATLFLASDVLLAFDRFHAPIPHASIWILALYWAGQTLIALSIPNAEAQTLERASERLRR